MIPMTWESYYAYSKWWVVKIRERSGVLSVFIIFQIPWRELGSRPDEGSSKKITFDFPIKAFAKESFLLFPPERFLTNFPF